MLHACVRNFLFVVFCLLAFLGVFGLFGIFVFLFFWVFFYVLHFAEDKHGIQNISTDYIIKCFIYSFLDGYFLNLLQISRYGHHYKSVRKFRKLHCDRCLYLFLVNGAFRGNNNYIILNLYHQWTAGHMQFVGDKSISFISRILTTNVTFYMYHQYILYHQSYYMHKTIPLLGNPYTNIDFEAIYVLANCNTQHISNYSFPCKHANIIIC